MHGKVLLRGVLQKLQNIPENSKISNIFTKIISFLVRDFRAFHEHFVNTIHCNSVSTAKFMQITYLHSRVVGKFSV
jgi:hypothetical protein